MNKVILVSRNGRPSMTELFKTLVTNGVMLLDRIGTKGGEKFRLIQKGKKTIFSSVASTAIKDSILIRWGNRIEIGIKNCIVYNESKGVANASNKKLARQLMAKAGIDTPKLIDPENFDLQDLPIIARPIYHSRGKDVVILKTQDQFLVHWNTHNKKGGWYYSNIINKDREIRIQCAHGKVLAVVEKTPPKDKSQVAWNLAQIEIPWTVIPWDKYVGNWCRKALGACDALGLDFGAVDLIIKGNKAYVLEVNTSAGLGDGEYMKKRYGMYFDWLFRSNKKREHFKWQDLKEGSSFAWKNFQLLDQGQPANA